MAPFAPDLRKLPRTERRARRMSDGDVHWHGWWKGNAAMVHRRVSFSVISTFIIPCFFALGSPVAQAKTSRSVTPVTPVTPVTIDQASRHASGWVASRDSLEPIGCRVTHVFGMAGAQCYAVDASGATAQCTTRDRDLVSAAAAARRQGKLVFAWDESGTCTSIVSALQRNAEI